MSCVNGRKHGITVFAVPSNLTAMIWARSIIREVRADKEFLEKHPELKHEVRPDFKVNPQGMVLEYV